MNTRDVDELLKDARVVFGLRTQGHWPTVETMLANGSSWTEIGRAIGWDPVTAARFYDIERERA